MTPPVFSPVPPAIIGELIELFAVEVALAGLAVEDALTAARVLTKLFKRPAGRLLVAPAALVEWRPA